MSEIWTVAYNIVLVILGINALIIVHEWGHFIVARMCGVRCEKFYIWFDFWGLKFFKFKWGNTEYGLGLFPLGGYVKMLGQEDNPGELRKELERAKTAGTGDLPPNENEQTPPQPGTGTSDKLNEAVFAKDSFLAKSVPQRLAIIVAGVVMNFIFAVVCATAAYMVGIEETAPSIGSVVPGSPAWDVGLEAGDRITAINGSPARMFTDINMAMVGNESGVKLAVERVYGKSEITVIPRKRPSDLIPMIGIGPLPTLHFASNKQAVYDNCKPLYPKETLDELTKRLTDLRILEVNGTAVKTFAEFQEEQLKQFDKPVNVGFVNAKNEPYQTEVPAIPMLETGLRFRMGSIVNILPGSDAEEKGIKTGDKIVAVDGQTDLDPLKLPQLILQKVNEGKTSVELKLMNETNIERIVVIELKPERQIPQLGFLSMKDPVGSTALGLTWTAEPVIETGELAGKRVISVKILNAERVLKNSSFMFADSEGVQFTGVGDKVDIPYIFDKILNNSPVKKNKPPNPLVVRLGIEENGKPTTVDLPVFYSKDWFNTDRGFLLKAESVMVKITSFGEALQLGTAKMVEYSLSVFKFLQALTNGSVSPRALSGPVGIVSLAYRFADNGFGTYLLFLCMIGANLAVINVLPIPVLDGGHVVFLLYEGITGKAPNETFQVIVSYMGLALILALMVWVISLDLSCISRF
ncbi:MAG: site-2 protease family protein [Planctomycetaceae bacterium]|jgi:regulator of sigma E protease|nr:site-2 protease family protein [Planctomycetaceae bacterium]